jgi:biopolymer transport protein ExbB
LRRVATLAPLLGLLGTLFALGRVLETIPTATGTSPIDAASLDRPVAERSLAWGPALASALGPLTSGMTLAILALVAYDGVLTRVEKLAGALDRLGAETIEAIALIAPPSPAPMALSRISRIPHESSAARTEKRSG